MPPPLRTLSSRLQALALVGALAVTGTALTGLNGFRAIAATEQRADVYEEALLEVARVETAGEHLHVALALREVSPRDAALAGEAAAAAEAWAELLEEEVTGQIGPAASALARTRTQALRLTEQVAAAAEGDGTWPSGERIEEVHDSLELVAEQIETVAEAAEETAIAARSSAERALAVIALLTVVVLGLLAWLVAGAAVRSLRGVVEVAAAVTAGDLRARTGLVGVDEVGRVGRSLDEMADTLQALLASQRLEAEQQEFGNRLGAALEHADTAPAVLEVAGRAMDLAGPGRPMELLLADSSRAHMQSAAVSPASGGPGCRVATPHGCPAVRAGGAVVIEQASALDACPRLRERTATGGAVCVPITFMGRALGVLHTAHEQEGPTDQAVVTRMRALAALTGSRLGTVRALASAELQASTDLLTGLCNRRTAEDRLRELQDGGAPYGLVLLDLDHFKAINDTYGHEAGDRALRVFATVLPAALREQDTAARWGGEEFLLVLPGATVEDARLAAERVREQLAQVLRQHSVPHFTVSAGVSDSLSGALLEEQVAAADAALLAAKRQGRDQVVAAGVLPGVPAPRAAAQVQ